MIKSKHLKEQKSKDLCLSITAIILSIFSIIFFNKSYIINNIILVVHLFFIFNIIKVILKKNNNRKFYIEILLISLLYFLLKLVFYSSLYVIVYSKLPIIIMNTLLLYLLYFSKQIFSILNIKWEFIVFCIICVIVFGLIREDLWKIVALMLACIQIYFSYDILLYNYKKRNKYAIKNKYSFEKREYRYRFNLAKFKLLLNFSILFAFLTIIISDYLTYRGIINEVSEFLFGNISRIELILSRGIVSVLIYFVFIILFIILIKLIYKKSPGIDYIVADKILNNKFFEK